MTTTSPTSDLPALDLLAIAPHPDDAELFCGGTLATSVAQGHRVGILDLTAGELSSRGTVESRTEEATKAAATLGIAYRFCATFPDGSIDASGKALTVEGISQEVALVRILRELQPKVVLIPAATGRHPDHVATHQLCTRALFFAGVTKFDSEENHPRYLAGAVLHYHMRHEASVDIVIDVSERYAIKQAAIACFASQVATANGDTSQPATLLSSSLNLPSLEARDRFYGSMIGVAHGEAFSYASPVAIADPVAFFSSNKQQKPLFFKRT